MVTIGFYTIMATIFSGGPSVANVNPSSMAQIVSLDAAELLSGNNVESEISVIDSDSPVTGAGVLDFTRVFGTYNGNSMIVLPTSTAKSSASPFNGAGPLQSNTCSIFFGKGGSHISYFDTSLEDPIATGDDGLEVVSSVIKRKYIVSNATDGNHAVVIMRVAVKNNTSSGITVNEYGIFSTSRSQNKYTMIMHEKIKQGMYVWANGTTTFDLALSIPIPKYEPVGMHPYSGSRALRNFYSAYIGLLFGGGLGGDFENESSDFGPESLKLMSIDGVQVDAASYQSDYILSGASITEKNGTPARDWNNLVLTPTNTARSATSPFFDAKGGTSGTCELWFFSSMPTNYEINKETFNSGYPDGLVRIPPGQTGVSEGIEVLSSRVDVMSFTTGENVSPTCHGEFQLTLHISLKNTSNQEINAKGVGFVMEPSSGYKKFLMALIRIGEKKDGEAKPFTTDFIIQPGETKRLHLVLSLSAVNIYA